MFYYEKEFDSVGFHSRSQWLDVRSGERYHRGFTAMIEKPKQEPGETHISTVLFDNETQVLHDRVDIQMVPQMTGDDYYVRGSTALLDAVGKAIHLIGNVHKYAREEDRPEKTLFVITTDGMGNTSREYSYDRLKKMIQRQKETTYGWEFIFLGANIDAAKEAARFGISEDRAATYHADHEGTAVIYEAVCDTVCSVRACKPMSADWKQKVDKDFQNRGKQHEENVPDTRTQPEAFGTCCGGIKPIVRSEIKGNEAEECTAQS